MLAPLQAPPLSAPTGRLILPSGPAAVPALLDSRASATVAVPSLAAPTPPTLPTPPAPPTAHASALRTKVTIAAVVSHPRPLAPGSTAVLDLHLMAQTPLTGAILDVEIANWSGTRVYQTWRGPETVAAGTTQSMRVSWTVPAGQTAGSYTVGAGIFSPDWSHLYDWTNAVASVVITAPRTHGQTSSPLLHVAVHRTVPPELAAPPRTIVSKPVPAPVAPIARLVRGHAMVAHALRTTRPAPVRTRTAAPRRRHRHIPPMPVMAPRHRPDAAHSMMPRGPSTASRHRPDQARITVPRHLPHAVHLTTWPAHAGPATARSAASVTRPARLPVPPHGDARIQRAGRTPGAPAQSTGGASTTSTTVSVRVAGLRLRSGPSLDAPVCAVLNAGTTLHGDRLTPHWMHVTVAGSSLSGWVFRAYVAP